MATTADTQSRYTPDCGKVPVGEKVTCGVCGAVMNERRNVSGPRSWAQAISRGSSPHDVFECPHMNEDWHKQVVALRRKARNSVSKKLADMMLQEADEILSSKTATKKIYFHI